ncbi:MAG TPA: hypothetical protein VFD72_04500 [Sphingobacteriaceae bacterium]|nr:hypothetical protein [Sphingobacteriaceae bacterium]
MMIKLYDPFQKFNFSSDYCFLSGENLSSRDEEIQVVPTWLMQKYGLSNQMIQMLDERVASYKELKLPCSTEVADRIDRLEQKVAAAFLDGYEAVSTLSQVELFQWIGKLVYGMIFNEIQAGIRQQAAVGEPMNFSHVLTHKFKHLHAMLQSLVLPIEFDGALPFNIQVFPVNNPENTFSYRDEINTLVFSLRMRDFGIIATLQDNGTNAMYHAEYLEGVKDWTLHPVQFEELCGRFFYSAYLFNTLPEYTLLATPEKVYIEPMPLTQGSAKGIFDPWQVKVFGQVLENFWKPWGMTLFEIIKDPEKPMSFLKDEAGAFLKPESVQFPLGGNEN